MAASIVGATPVILFLDQGLWYLPLGLVYPNPAFYSRAGIVLNIQNRLIKIIGTFISKQWKINNAHLIKKILSTLNGTYQKHFKWHISKESSQQ